MVQPAIVLVGTTIAIQYETHTYEGDIGTDPALDVSGELVEIYLDDVLYKSVVTDSLGHFSASVTFNASGTHTLKAKWVEPHDILARVRIDTPEYFVLTKSSDFLMGVCYDENNLPFGSQQSVTLEWSRDGGAWTTPRTLGVSLNPTNDPLYPPDGSWSILVSKTAYQAYSMMTARVRWKNPSTGLVEGEAIKNIPVYATEPGGPPPTVMGWNDCTFAAPTNHAFFNNRIESDRSFLYACPTAKLYNSTYGLLASDIGQILTATRDKNGVYWFISYVTGGTFVVQGRTSNGTLVEEYVPSDPAWPTESRPMSIYATKDGGLVVVAHTMNYQTQTRLRFYYRTPVGTWNAPVTVEPPITSTGNITSQRATICQHPTSKGIFYFYKRDSYHEAGCVHLHEEMSSGEMPLVVDWVNPSYLSDANGTDNVEGELPFLEAVEYEGNILLGHQNENYTIFNTSPFQKGANLTFWRIYADGTKTVVTRLAEWAERVARFSVVRTDSAPFGVIWWSANPVLWGKHYLSKFDGTTWGAKQLLMDGNMDYGQPGSTQTEYVGFYGGTNEYVLKWNNQATRYPFS